MRPGSPNSSARVRAATPCASRAKTRPMSANSSATAERRFALAELKRCDSSDPALPVLIAHAGRVYDVSRSYPWARGRHWGDLRAGQDLTGRMDTRIHGPEMLARVPCVGVLEDGPALAVLMLRVLESVREHHAGLQSFRSMRRMGARRRKASALRLRHSQSLASLRQRPSQAKVRSTIQRLGRVTKPFA